MNSKNENILDFCINDDCKEYIVYNGIFDDFFIPLVNKLLSEVTINEKKIKKYFAIRYKNELIGIYLYSLMEYYDNSNLDYKNYQQLFTNKSNQINAYDSFYEIYSDLKEVTKVCLVNTLSYIDQFIVDISFDFDLEKIAFISEGENDSHNNGKTNIVFEYGYSRYVYKPRLAEIDFLFYDFLEFIRKYDLYINIGKINIKQYENASLHEWVKKRERVSNPEEIYEEFGKLIGLTLLFNSSDLHHENVLVERNQLYLVDLETIFTPEFFSGIKGNSVLKSMLLPFNYLSENNFEVAALTATEEYQMDNFHYSLYQVINHGTDQICFADSDVVLKKQRNSVENNEHFKVFDYVSNLIKGFQISVNIFLENKNSIKNYFEMNFNNQEIRVVLRPTHVYGKLLETSYYSEITSTENGREKFLREMLYNEDLEIKIKNQVDKEIEKLLVNDIPCFYTKLDQVDLYDNNGIISSDFFEKSVKESVLNNLDIIDEEFIKEQICQIKMSLTTSNSYLKKSEDSKMFTSIELLNNPMRISDVLKTFVSPFYKNEIMMINTQGEHRQLLAPFNYNMYDTGGLLLSLANAGKINDYEIIDRKVNEYYHMTGSNKGSFVSDGSFIFVKYALSKINPNSKYFQDQYKQSKKKLDTIVENKDIDLDFLAGHVGFCYVLFKIYEDSKENDIYVHANELVHLIMNKVESLDYEELKQLSCSLPHGIAGIILMLSIAYKFNENKKRIMYLLKKLIKIEDSYFNAYLSSWITPKYNEYQDYWCYGSVGILFSRVSAFKYADIEFKPEYKKSIEVLVNKQKNHEFENYSLCHGSLGVIELVRLLKKLNLIDKDIGINDFITKSLSGTNHGEENYNFMTGISGVFYNHLRENNKINNLLMLDLGGEL